MRKTSSCEAGQVDETEPVSELRMYDRAPETTEEATWRNQIPRSQTHDRSSGFSYVATS
jgi:hypothetical protein